MPGRQYCVFTVPMFTEGVTLFTAELPEDTLGRVT